MFTNSPERLLIFRILHIDRLAFVFKHGEHCANSPLQDSSFISIGDSDIIQRRKEKTVPVGNGGPLADYVPFYLGVRSPMLYRITKPGQVGSVPQSQIVYLVCSITRLETLGLAYVFTNGNASWQTTQFHSQNDRDKFASLDWEAINAVVWNEPIVQTPKQSEVLVHGSLPVAAILAFAVADEKAQMQVRSLLADASLSTLQIGVRPGFYFW